jgi:hypothetical protein
MTFAQMGRLLGLQQNTVERLVAAKHDVFEVKHPPKSMKRGRYEVPNRVRGLVRLTDEALEEWRVRDELQRVRNHVPPEMLPQTLKIAELFNSLYQAGELYGRWDLQLPLMPGLHAELIRQSEPKQTLGVFVQPDRLNVDEQRNSKRIVGSIARQVAGVVHKGTAKGQVSRVLFLSTPRYFYATLDAIAHLRSGGCHCYAIPFESFMSNPSWYLTAIAQEERPMRQSLLEHLPTTERLRGLRNDYAATVLIEDRYRMVDVFCSGSADKVRQWLSETKGVATHDPKRDAVGRVYVENETMRVALEKILSDRRRHHEPSIVEVYPWPEGMDTSSTKSAVIEDEFEEAWSDEEFLAAMDDPRMC